MAAGDPMEIEGLHFTPTDDGTLSVDEVRQHLKSLQARLQSLEDENASLRRLGEHNDSLRRLAESSAEATVVRADELAAQIEEEARERAAGLLRDCDTDIASRRREFEEVQAAELAALQSRANQLQTALAAATHILAEA